MSYTRAPGFSHFFFKHCLYENGYQLIAMAELSALWIICYTKNLFCPAESVGFFFNTTNNRCVIKDVKGGHHSEKVLESTSTWSSFWVSFLFSHFLKKANADLPLAQELSNGNHWHLLSSWYWAASLCWARLFVYSINMCGVPTIYLVVQKEAGKGRWSLSSRNLSSNIQRDVSKAVIKMCNGN